MVLFRKKVRKDMSYVTRETPHTVEEVAAILDKEVPNWFHKVDTGILDMNDESKCIFGQVFGNYERGCVALGICAWSGDGGKDSSLALIPEREYTNVELSLMWIQQVRERLGA